MSQITSYGSGGGGGGTGILILNYTNVTTSPYVVQATDSFLGVETSTIPITIELPNNPGVGRVYVIKDINGTAYLHNITVTTVGGVVTIDGATTFIMNSSFESIQLLFDGTEYLIF